MRASSLLFSLLLAAPGFASPVPQQLPPGTVPPGMPQEPPPPPVPAPGPPPRVNLPANKRREPFDNSPVPPFPRDPPMWVHSHQTKSVERFHCPSIRDDCRLASGPDRSEPNRVLCKYETKGEGGPGTRTFLKLWGVHGDYVELQDDVPKRGQGAEVKALPLKPDFNWALGGGTPNPNFDFPGWTESWDVYYSGKIPRCKNGPYQVGISVAYEGIESLQPAWGQVGGCIVPGPHPENPQAKIVGGRIATPEPGTSHVLQGSVCTAYSKPGCAAEDLVLLGGKPIEFFSGEGVKDVPDPPIKAFLCW